VRESLESVARSAYRSSRLAKTYLRASYKSYPNKDLFEDVQAYCMFVGYPKSGHSLLGSLLDAHPNALIAHELDALRYLKAGFGRSQLYQLLLENSRKYARAGREWNVYSYQVPNQWQGRFQRLALIGDKKGGVSTVRLDANPGLLHKLRKTVGVPVKFIHVVRNPYDNIVAMYKRPPQHVRDPSLGAIVEDYLARCKRNARLKERLGSGAVFDLRHESFVEDPWCSLRELCGFLDLGYDEDYLEACASVVFQSQHKSRYEIEWDAASLAAVRAGIRKFDFLEGYSYEK
jgi:hypothetical protein